MLFNRRHFSCGWILSSGFLSLSLHSHAVAKMHKVCLIIACETKRNGMDRLFFSVRDDNLYTRVECLRSRMAQLFFFSLFKQKCEYIWTNKRVSEKSVMRSLFSKRLIQKTREKEGFFVAIRLTASFSTELLLCQFLPLSLDTHERGQLGFFDREKGGLSSWLSPFTNSEAALIL